MVLNYEHPYQLKEALIILPPNRKIDTPQIVDFKQAVDLSKVSEELSSYADLLSGLGVSVHLVKCTRTSLPNIMFASDNTLAYQGSLYLPSMGEMRRGEPKYLYRRFPESILLPEDIPFESSDLLVAEDFMILGVKNRTSTLIIESLTKMYKDKNLVFMTVPEGIQHLMGVVRPLSRDRVMVRGELVSERDLGTLETLYRQVIKVHETKEISEGLAFNFVPINANEVVMPLDTPTFERFLKDLGVTVHTTSIENLRKADGGLACATGRMH